MAASVGDSNPYVGPRAFQMGERLYGREREANQLVNLIIAERIVLLHSPSGAGKTSLIQAALIPRLTQMKFEVLPVVRVNLLPSGLTNGNAAGNRYVLSALLSLEEGAVRQAVKQPLAAGQLARMTLADYLAQRPRSEGNPDIEVLIFDQFEEILTLNPTDQAAKREFFEQLGEALEEPRRWALFSMREDHVAALDPYKLPIPSRFASTFRLDLLGQESARHAIQEPAREAGVTFEDAAAEKLVDDLRRVRVQQPDGALEPTLGPYIEPVQLQVVCYRLWGAPRPDPLRITEQDLAAVGEVDQSLVDRSLAEYYAQRVAAAAAETGISERSIREWFDRRLITEQGVRGTVLMGVDRSGELDNRAIQLLVNAHLIRGEKRGGATWFELSHDRLIGPVRTDNAAWFKANLSPLQQQADLWSQRGRPESLLFSHQELEQARLWAADHKAELLPVEGDFLAASQEQVARALRLRRRNRIIAMLGVASMLLVMIVLAFAWQVKALSRFAERQTRVARVGQLAGESRADLQDFPPRAMLWAIEALQVTSQALEPRQAAAEEALRAALQDPHGLPLGGYDDGVAVVAFSPPSSAGGAGQRWLATGGSDGAVRLWPMDAVNPVGQPLTLPGHQKLITALAFSPAPPEGDGHWLATGSEDGTVRLWDVSATDPSIDPVDLDASGDPVYALAFGPASPAGGTGARWLAAGGLDGKVRLWDLSSSESAGRARELPGDHDGQVTTLAFSPDGHWLASGSQDRTVQLWDMSAGSSAANPWVLDDHKGLISALAFSPDGRWLATGSRDKTVRLWDLTDSDSTADPTILPGHLDWINTLAFSPDGRWLATGSGDSTARLWDMRAADPAFDPIVLRGHRGWIGSLAFSADGRWLATAGDDKTARLWDLQAPDPAADPSILRGHEDQINSVAFSPASPEGALWLATGSADRTARLWAVNPADPSTDPLVLGGHADQINTLAFSPAPLEGDASGRWLATGGGDPARDDTDNAVRLWDMTAPDPSARPLSLPEHDRWIQTLAISPNGRWLATGSGDGAAKLWDLRAADPAAHPRTLLGHEGFVWTLAFSPDGRRLATGGQDTTVRLWDLGATDPAVAPTVLPGHADRITAVAFSPDGHWLATGSRDKTVRLWDLSAGDSTAAPRILDDHTDWITALAFSPDSRWLATGSEDRTARLWDLGAAEPTAAPSVLGDHTDWVTTLGFSPDGRWLATGSRDKTVQLYPFDVDGPSGERLVLRGHSGSVTGLAFRAAPPERGASGHRLATGSEDGNVLLWDLQAANPAADPVTLRGHEGPITALAFSSDGRWLATGSKDHTARLWRLSLDELVSLACRSAGRNLTPDEWQQFYDREIYHRTCD